MTPAGFTRLIELYVADLTAVKYNLDGVPKTVTSFQTRISNNQLEVVITLPEEENGNFTDFQVIATGDLVSTTRSNTFTKSGQQINFVIPFIFVNG